MKNDSKKAENIKKTHEFYYHFEADSNTKIGFLMGQKFSEQAKKINRLKNRIIKNRLIEYEKLLTLSEKFFPGYIDEFEAYANGANVDPIDLWNYNLEQAYFGERCSTAVIDKGRTVMHLEDGNYVTKTEICLVERSIRNSKKLEFFYYNSLGGDAVGINNNKMVLTVNNLYCKEKRSGVPKNVLTRAISDCESISQIKDILDNIPRHGSYNFNLIFYDKDKDSIKPYNIELTPRSYILTKIETPFFHTNHYLQPKLQSFESASFSNKLTATTTNKRYDFMKNNIEDETSINKLKKITNELSGHRSSDLHYIHSDGRMIFDLNKYVAHIYLEREPSSGWIEYQM